MCSYAMFGRKPTSVLLPRPGKPMRDSLLPQSSKSLLHDSHKDPMLFHFGIVKQKSNNPIRLCQTQKSVGVHGNRTYREEEESLENFASRKTQF
mmetsp:Transcript_30429/g.78788  ORF Transcript_30429/g.78788 Transcript_30429/m.78788 type:complete len:94 (+) Transcript_30429:6891-7172(+)